jgi:hypothetical protein
MRKIFLISIMLLVLISIIGFGSALTIKDVSTDPSEVAPGEKVDVSIEFKNELDGDIEDIEVLFDLRNVPFAPESVSEIFIDILDEDDRETETITFFVEGDADAGIYKIPILINYLYEDVIKTKTATISVVINSEPSLSLNVDGVLIRNQKNEVNVRITNSGLNKAKFLEIEIGNGAYEIISSKKVYIGDLESDDFDTASFEIFLRDSSLVSFPITLRYKDSLNNAEVDNVILQAKVYSVEEAERLGIIQKSNSKTYFSIILVFLILFFGYRKIRKKKKK